MSPNKKPRAVNITLVSDDLLRPWTVNHQAQENLDNASKALDSIVSQTSPQTRAGLRGQSSLDFVPELNNFRKTFSSTFLVGGGNQVTFDDLPRSSKVSSKHASPRYEIPFSNPTPPLSSGQGPEDDYEHSAMDDWARQSLEKYRQRILQREEKDMMDKSLSVRKNPLVGIRYEPLKNPKVLNMSTSQYSMLQSKYHK